MERTIRINARGTLIDIPQRLIDRSPVIKTWFDAGPERDEAFELDVPPAAVYYLIVRSEQDKYESCIERLTNYLMVDTDHLNINYSQKTFTSNQLRLVWHVTFSIDVYNARRIVIDVVHDTNNIGTIIDNDCYYFIEGMVLKINDEPIHINNELVGTCLLHLATTHNEHLLTVAEKCGFISSYCPSIHYCALYGTEKIKNKKFAGFISLDYSMRSQCISEKSFAEFFKHLVDTIDSTTLDRLLGRPVIDRLKRALNKAMKRDTMASIDTAQSLLDVCGNDVGRERDKI